MRYDNVVRYYGTVMVVVMERQLLHFHFICDWFYMDSFQMHPDIYDIWPWMFFFMVVCDTKYFELPLVTKNNVRVSFCSGF